MVQIIMGHGVSGCFGTNLAPSKRADARFLGLAFHFRRKVASLELEKVWISR